MLGVEGVRFSFDSDRAERLAVNPQETFKAEAINWSGLMFKKEKKRFQSPVLQVLL